MTPFFSPSEAEWAAQVAAQQRLYEQAEAALAVSNARVTALEAQLAAATPPREDPPALGLEQGNFFTSLLEWLPAEVSVFDAAHRCVFVNPAAMAQDTVRQRVLGKTWTECGACRKLPAARQKQREEAFARALHTRARVLGRNTSRETGSQTRRVRPAARLCRRRRVAMGPGHGRRRHGTPTG
jgi:PAS domain-containing protein